MKTHLLLAAGILVIHASQAAFFKNGTRGLLSFLFGRPRICNCLCGRPNRLVTRLENGEFAQAHEFPWLAAIILNGTRLASGALINDRYVLTAFSPLAGLTPYQIKVTLGANDRCRLDTSSANVSVSDIIPLPNYDERTGAHDIALLKLTSPVTFNMNVNPICLPDTNARYLGQVATVVSWGRESNANATNTTANNNTTAAAAATNANGTVTGGRKRRDIGEVRLRYEDTDEEEEDAEEEEEVFFHRVRRQALSADYCLPKKLGLPVIGEGRCPDGNINSNLVLGDTGCAGISGALNQVCQGDAGAPVQYRDHRAVYQLIGIISGNNNCINSTMPTLYTMINPYVNWIYSRTQDACYCSQSLKFGF
ncbi:chymotrypsin A-like [Periplaneta americana]|uniref:chymotrypsin A-like n=1 Tax=Periplaneta americana TaxID=6978 RepID=UPI0037E7BEE2